MKNNYGSDLHKYSTCAIIGRSISGKTVLDVGCNDGYLAKACQDGIELWGIDYRPESVEQSMKENGYIKSIVADLNDPLGSIRLENKFDTLIFADVLEHLVDPEGVLDYFVDKFLKSGGQVVISLPNVANIVVRVNLLFGRFEYADSGILDRTHFHLYTYRTGMRLIEKAGLRVSSEMFSSNRFGWLVEKMPFLGPILGYNLIYICKK